MEDSLIAALDQGTTSTRCIIFDAQGDVVASSQAEHKQIYPFAGWVEHDPEEIFQRAVECIYGAVENLPSQADASRIRSLGVTNQRETVVVWDKASGKPLHNAIVWLDTRTQDTVDELKQQLSEVYVKETTGLPITSYFSGVKLRWLMDNNEDIAKAMHEGSALCGTIDTWLVWKLTAGKAHVTDPTNAGRTMLMNIHTCKWDPKMIEDLCIPPSALPTIKSSSEVFGQIQFEGARQSIAGLSIAGILGDQQAALVGQSCFGVGEAKSTYGTGGFLIVNTGTTKKFSSHGLLTTPAYQLGPNQPVVYSLEGSIAIAGAAVTWLRDSLGIVSSAKDIEPLASSVDDTGDVYFVPAFSGLFAPRWRPDARGTIVGITQYTTKAHIARATLLGIAFQVADVLKAVEHDLGHSIKTLRCDGGASANNLLMQMQADLIPAPVHRPKVIETTALGAAFAAGRAVGIFTDTSAFEKHWRLEKAFCSQIDDSARQKLFARWECAVDKSLNWHGHAE